MEKGKGNFYCFFNHDHHSEHFKKQLTIWKYITILKESMMSLIYQQKPSLNNQIVSNGVILRTWQCKKAWPNKGISNSPNW